MLAENPHLKIVFEMIAKYRNGAIDLEGLSKNLSAVVPSIEGDVPREVREHLISLENSVEMAFFTEEKAAHALKLEPMFAELKRLVSLYEEQ